MARRDERSGLRFLALGTEFAAAVLGLTLAGYWIDRHYGSSPWGTIAGAMIGLVGGMYNLVREALGAVRPAPDGDGDDDATPGRKAGDPR